MLLIVTSFTFFPTKLVQSIKSFDEDIGKSVGSKKYCKGKLYEYSIGLPEFHDIQSRVGILKHICKKYFIFLNSILLILSQVVNER